VFAICLSLAAAAAAQTAPVSPGPAGRQATEPGLLQTQQAAARVAAGSPDDDASRLARARNAHWAPQLRGQLDGKDDVKSRDGEFRLAPLRENDVGATRGWAVALTWDFSQVIFAREETQLALAHAHLARLRKEAAERAAALWLERQRAKQSKADCLQRLQLTAELDALTGGLFQDALAGEEAACVPEEKR
jgi:hypothetical protein